MKWNLIIKGIDFGVSIPKPEDLKPHDYPLKCWAEQFFGGMLGELVGVYQERIADEILKKSLDPKQTVVCDATIAIYRRDVEIAQYLRQNFELKQVPDDSPQKQES